MKYKDNIKKTWAGIKEVTWKIKMIHNNFSAKLIANRKNILNEKEIANKFNNFIVKIGLKLADKIQPSKYCYENYLTP